MKYIESPCQSLARLNNLFQYFDNNSYESKHISLSKLHFQPFKKFPIPQPFLEKEVEYNYKQQFIQQKGEPNVQNSTKNSQSLQEFTEYVAKVKQARKLRKLGMLNNSCTLIKKEKIIKSISTPKINGQSLIHQNIPNYNKRRNAKIEPNSPKSSKYQTWAKDFFTKFDNEKMRQVMIKQNKPEKSKWNQTHKQNYDKKIYSLDLRPETEQGIRQFQIKLLDKIKQEII